MHVILLRHVLRWPMELFDTTPLGRVLNRFAKEVDVIDNTLPSVVRACLVMIFGVIFFPTVIAISLFFAFEFIVFFLFFFIVLAKVYCESRESLEKL